MCNSQEYDYKLVTKLRIFCFFYNFKGIFLLSMPKKSLFYAAFQSVTSCVKVSLLNPKNIVFLTLFNTTPAGIFRCISHLIGFIGHLRYNNTSGRMNINKKKIVSLCFISVTKMKHFLKQKNTAAKICHRVYIYNISLAN